MEVNCQLHDSATLSLGKGGCLSPRVDLNAVVKRTNPFHAPAGNQTQASHYWKDNIFMDIKETGREGVNWIQLAKDRV
jgi:hypothetical protein